MYFWYICEACVCRCYTVGETGRCILCNGESAASPLWHSQCQVQCRLQLHLTTYLSQIHTSLWKYKCNYKHTKPCLTLVTLATLILIQTACNSTSVLLNQTDKYTRINTYTNTNANTPRTASYQDQSNSSFHIAPYFSHKYKYSTMFHTNNKFKTNTNIQSASLCISDTGKVKSTCLHVCQHQDRSQCCN